MNALKSTLHVLSKFNDIQLAAGRQLAWICVALMVAAILLQVFCRYILNNALPWPEEVARALMIWMMALVAGSGYRWGSFVAIDLISGFLSERAGKILKLALLVIAGLVLTELFVLALEFFQRGFRTRAASFNLARAWIYLAMPVCFGSMLLINFELVMRQIGQTFGHEEDFPDPLPYDFKVEQPPTGAS